MIVALTSAMSPTRPSPWILWLLLALQAMAVDDAPEAVPAPAAPYQDIPSVEGMQHFKLQRIHTRQAFDSPVALAIMPLPDPREVIMLQRGELWLLPKDEVLGKPSRFLDFREPLKKVVLFEEGFHGLAFHPDYARNNKFYISYSTIDPRRTVISEMRTKPGSPFRADRSTERILMEVPHIMANHFAGGIAFGQDGKLYVAIGDGGLRDDPYHMSQNPFDLHGKVLRIDVNTRTGKLPYGIPADNPFSEPQEVRSEIWALGLRNPWGFSFDKETGDLWLADVGQDIWEEINIIKKGGNYGWSDRDGPMPAAFRTAPFLPDRKYEEPIYAYTHAEGVSVTGGYLYRGKRLPRLQGCFIYGDWGHGTLWGLRYDQDSKTVQQKIVIYKRSEDSPAFNPTMISEDANGEPVIMSQEGAIYTLLNEEP